MRSDNDNRQPRGGALPLGVSPRGYSRDQAAEYIGISPSKFDLMVADGSMPQPKLLGTRTIWDRSKLDIAFDALPDRAAVNPWDDDDGEVTVGKIQAARRYRRG